MYINYHKQNNEIINSITKQFMVPRIPSLCRNRYIYSMAGEYIGFILYSELLAVYEESEKWRKDYPVL